MISSSRGLITEGQLPSSANTSCLISGVHFIALHGEVYCMGTPRSSTT